jgi:hypothetical protein
MKYTTGVFSMANDSPEPDDPIPTPFPNGGSDS